MTQSIDGARLTLMLNDLRLPAIKQDWAGFAERADKESWPAARFLAALAEHEIAERDRRRLARHLAEAQLLPGKTLDSFDFDVVPMASKAHVLAICAGDSWIDKGANLLLIGDPAAARRIWPPALASRCGERLARDVRPHIRPGSKASGGAPRRSAAKPIISRRKPGIGALLQQLAKGNLSSVSHGRPARPCGPPSRTATTPASGKADRGHSVVANVVANLAEVRQQVVLQVVAIATYAASSGPSAGVARIARRALRAVAAGTRDARTVPADEALLAFGLHPRRRSDVRARRDARPGRGCRQLLAGLRWPRRGGTPSACAASRPCRSHDADWASASTTVWNGRRRRAKLAGLSPSSPRPRSKHRQQDSETERQPQCCHGAAPDALGERFQNRLHAPRRIDRDGQDLLVEEPLGTRRKRRFAFDIIRRDHLTDPPRRSAERERSCVRRVSQAGERDARRAVVVASFARSPR